MHYRKPWEGSTRSKRLPKGWAKKREFVLFRDPICRLCNKAPSVEVHHLGDPDDHRLEQLAGVCADCHKQETAKQAAAARAAAR